MILVRRSLHPVDAGKVLASLHSRLHLRTVGYAHAVGVDVLVAESIRVLHAT